MFVPQTISIMLPVTQRLVYLLTWLALDMRIQEPRSPDKRCYEICRKNYNYIFLSAPAVLTYTNNNSEREHESVPPLSVQDIFASVWRRLPSRFIIPGTYSVAEKRPPSPPTTVTLCQSHFRSFTEEEGSNRGMVCLPVRAWLQHSVAYMLTGGVQLQNKGVQNEMHLIFHLMHWSDLPVLCHLCITTTIKRSVLSQRHWALRVDT